jgi:GTP-binding protein Era
VGKSTLLNRVLGEKLAITSSKPQTTRNRITGIRNTDDGQMIFLDTPGIHQAKTPLNRYMVKAATSTFSEVDLILLLVEADRGHDADDDLIIESLRQAGVPVFLVINKIDLVEKLKLLPLIDRFRSLYDFQEIVPVSAVTGDGVDRLLELIREVLPEGPKYFPDDLFTDNSERFIAAEIVREKILILTHKEIPYATAVTVDSFKEDEEKNLIRIAATITVEKDSQKGILIGKGGKMLKEIGTQARVEMERFFAAKIFLELFVRVRKDWTKDAKWLKEFGYSDK